MRSILSAILLLSWLGGVAAQDATFSVSLGGAVLCLDDVDPQYFYNYISKTRPAYKHEQGAYWFQAPTQMFGVPVTEVFISDGRSRHSFVGIVSSLPPDQLAEAVMAAAPAGVVFTKLNPAEKFSTYMSRTGSVIAFHGKTGKMYCRRDRVLD